MSRLSIGIGKQVGRGVSFNWSTYWTTLLLTSTGDGTGVAKLILQSIDETTVTLGANAKFYSDAAGTLNESATWTITPGADRTIYLKCTSGTATFDIQGGKISRWANWDSPVNAPSMGGDISAFKYLNYLHTEWANSNNTLSGDISSLTLLEYVRIFGSNTLSGTLANMSNLLYIAIGGSNTLGGDISGLTQIEVLDNISATCTHYGDISALTNLYYLWFYGNCNITGNVNNLTDLSTLVITATNDITGDLANLTKLEVMRMSGGNALTCSRLINATALHDFQLTSSQTFTNANIDQLVTDVWTNKDEAKPPLAKVFNMNLTSASGTHTFAGLGFGYAFILESEGWDVNIVHTSMGDDLIDQAQWYNLAYWNVHDANWSSVDSKLRTTVVSGYLTKWNFWETGKKYYIQIELDLITAVTNGIIQPYDGGPANADFFLSEEIKYKFYYTPPSNTRMEIINDSLAGDIKSLSVKEVL